jgi:hypothetical protein
MTFSFGPWTTAMHAGSAAHLSTFWKRRMTMLRRVSQSPATLTRRTLLVLMVGCAAACVLPTIQVLPVAAEPGAAADGEKELTGRIYLTVIRRKDGEFETMIIAVDPKTGKWKRICDGNRSHGVRVSADGGMMAFGKISDGVWTGGALEGSSPARIFERGSPAGWSSDGKQLLVNDGKFEEGKTWEHESWRMTANGMDVTKLTIPETDSVSDWSPDGKWIVTFSDRHPPHGSGYQLYVMRPDGTQQRRLTQGKGLNVNARFSPDGRQVVYVHSEKATSSIWVVNIDGTAAKKILEEEDLAGIAAASWSPDGKRLVVGRFDWERNENGNKFLGASEDHNHRFEIMDADGKNRKELKLEDLKPIWMGHPEWR